MKKVLFIPLISVSIIFILFAGVSSPARASSLSLEQQNQLAAISLSFDSLKSLFNKLKAAIMEKITPAYFELPVKFLKPKTVYANQVITIKPQEYAGGLRNPLKGIRNPISHYGSIFKTYVGWNEIENRASDGVDKIIDYTNRGFSSNYTSTQKWTDLMSKNMKVILRVYLEWPNRKPPNPKTVWPSDMTTGDYSSAQFKQRVVKLIKKMAQAWDNDPRVGFINMGIIGWWGEHHHPHLSAEMQQILGDAFKKYFKNKLIMVRYPSDFKSYQFGFHKDDFLRGSMSAFESDLLKNRWKTAPMGGEIDYNLLSGNTPKDSNDALLYHSDLLTDLFRRYHYTEMDIRGPNYNVDNRAALQAKESL
ncbi:MAG TPA: hypothetical protein ENH22_00270, partial [Candidatus Campbellbacteria bacterium]|nr:hypothetical protein [Candidatus Campbellbacteria bacterium]